MAYLVHGARVKGCCCHGRSSQQEAYESSVLYISALELRSHSLRLGPCGW